jgi:hypothetical protein
MAQSSAAGEAAIQSERVGNVATGIETEMHGWATGAAPEVLAATKDYSTGVRQSHMYANSARGTAVALDASAAEVERKGDKGAATALRSDAKAAWDAATKLTEVHHTILRGSVDKIVAAAEASMIPAPSDNPGVVANHRAEIDRVAVGNVAGMVKLAARSDPGLAAEVSTYGLRRLVEGADARTAKDLTSAYKALVIAGAVNAPGASAEVKAAGRLLANQGRLYGMTDAHRTTQQLKAQASADAGKPAGLVTTAQVQAHMQAQVQPRR